MKIRIQRVDKNLELPKFAKESDAAFDLRSSVDLLIKPLEKAIIPSGIKIAIPEKHVGLIWDRSGMAAKHSLTTMGGVLDAGYRGEIQIVMINLGKENFQVTKGMRIAQMLVQPVLNHSIEEVENLDETTRGETGLGSTGLN
ncbi:dUTP diphosphatase [Candidatus Woesearchaeota archaeon CG10_big_fil_rev_8_21_14_0_10_30_7]|nr:MAG: dUTP diphosphatase [Candidatus Woesearchaeota archaeon CG10_big_fil_rev_8_21_14_0_10_30_7]